MAAAGKASAAGPDGAPREGPGEGRPLVLLVHGDGWETRFQASSLAASAVAAGRQVDLCLFFAALACWTEERWDEPPAEVAGGEKPAAPVGGLPRTVTAERLGALGFPPLTSLLAPGREEGRLRLHACSASVRLLGLPADRVQARVDTLSGWPTFHRLIRRAGQVVTF